jgi:hypothetical protein
MKTEPARHTRLAIAGVSLALIGFCAGRMSVPRKSLTQASVSPTADVTARVPGKQAESNPEVEPPRSPSLPVSSTIASRWDDSLWRELISQPGTVARNQRLAALLESLAVTDPLRALSLAQQENNLKLREALVHASLRGWGSAATGDAADWALANVADGARDSAIAAVFSGAAARPESALQAAKKICADHPGEATGYGNSAIDALCDAGNFSKAIELIAGSANDIQRSIWTTEAYSRWAALQPDQAAQAAAALTDPTARTEALQGVIGGWAQADPAALTHFLAEQPAGGDRGSMLGQALQSWVRQDPAAAVAWMNDREASPDYDEGVAAVASVNVVKPSQALTWAETISDPRLRSETVAEVLHGWAIEDLAAAKQYFATTKDLLPEDRRRVGEIIATGESTAR